MSEFFSPQIIWVIVGLLLVMCEFALPGLVIIFFGFGAIVTGIVCAISGIGINAQLIVFLASSITSFIVLRKYLKNIFHGSAKSDGEVCDFDEFTGRHVTVVRDIPAGGVGKIEYHGSEWNARSGEAIEAGVEVEIVSKEGLTLNVKKI